MSGLSAALEGSQSRPSRVLHPRPAPVARGRGWRHHSLQLPTYSAAPWRPATSKASSVWQAVTPEPQWTASRSGATSPSRARYWARSASGSLKRGP